MAPEMAAKGVQPARKRKLGSTDAIATSKKAWYDADPRSVKTQPTESAFQNGEVDIAKFVKAREFEIQALEHSMRTAGKMRNNRAFQQVPRELRRRTASHNAKKVPKRLRQRAKREMGMDNTPTVQRRRREPTPHLRLRLETARSLKTLAEKARKRAQGRKLASMEVVVEEGPRTRDAHAIRTKSPQAKKNSLKAPDRPKAKFRKRQIDKTWLPTHLYHAKRAHMTPPREPLWGFALPITPTLKGYRASHRASTIRGALAWDVSYVSTIGLEGLEKSLEGLLKALGVGSGESFASTWGRSGQRWRAGTRAWHGWLHEREKYPQGAIAPATIIWCHEDPSARPQVTKQEQSKRRRRKLFVRVHPAAFTQLWEETLRLAKVQKPAVSIEDLRFEIGSIEVAGPQSTEALVAVIYPMVSDLSPGEADPLVANAAAWKKLGSITNPATLPSNVSISFTMADPRYWWPPRQLQLPSPTDMDAQTELLRLCADWPLDNDQRPQKIFSREARLAAQRSMRSQKSVNRRKALAGFGSYPEYEAADPHIPVLLHTHATSNGAAYWTVLLPWKCVGAVWKSLVDYGLTTGGRVRLGCLQEQRQIAFETSRPWFPGDFPGTRAGDEWERLESEKRKAAWERRPKGKRVEYGSVPLGPQQKGEVGDGWSCAWELLFGDLISELQIPAHIPREAALTALSKPDEDGTTVRLDGLITIKVTMLSKGATEACARIYRLPAVDRELRQAWETQEPERGSRKRRKAHQLALPNDAPQQIRSRALARSLLNPANSRAGTAEYPHVPTVSDLIGFITSANFNLGEGKGTGVGSVRLGRILPRSNNHGMSKSNRLCIVRNSGQKFGRLALWELA